ncbi:MAG TPA: hypothetical protein VKH42_15690 [Vicinamibacterales bacterium]|nr:hypothetical protein [Vicinamibacterales bacterium]
MVKRIAFLAALLVASAAPARAQASAADAEYRPTVLFGAGYASRTQLTGEVGLLIPVVKPEHGDDLGDTLGHKGLEIEASAGTGGVRVAAGAAWLAKAGGGPVLFAADVLGTVTRTSVAPRGAGGDSTYVGVEAGWTVMMVRVSAGVAHRVAGPDGPHETAFTWSVGFHTGR